MGFSELIRQRVSVRSYSAAPVSPEVLNAVLEDACLAPTAANRQAFRLIVINTSERRPDLQRIYARDWFVQAPLVIGICALTEDSWVRGDGKNYADVDAAIVMDHLILSAADRGLGTCWVGAFDALAAREVLGLPAGVEPIAFTPLGYADEAPRPKRRQSVHELVRRDRW